MLARSEWVSVVPGSAYRPFLVVGGMRPAAEESVWEAVRAFNLALALELAFGFALG